MEKFICYLKTGKSLQGVLELTQKNNCNSDFDYDQIDSDMSTVGPSIM